jgi:hypothetical protein
MFSEKLTGVLMEKWGRGCPRGSKNKPKDASLVSSSSVSPKRCPSRPVGSKNKPKVSAAAAPGSSTASRNASPPAPAKIFHFSVSLVLNAVRYSVFR